MIVVEEVERERQHPPRPLVLEVASAPRGRRPRAASRPGTRRAPGRGISWSARTARAPRPIQAEDEVGLDVGDVAEDQVHVLRHLRAPCPSPSAASSTCCPGRTTTRSPAGSPGTRSAAAASGAAPTAATGCSRRCGASRPRGTAASIASMYSSKRTPKLGSCQPTIGFFILVSRKARSSRSCSKPSGW